MYDKNIPHLTKLTMQVKPLIWQTYYYTQRSERISLWIRTTVCVFSIGRTDTQAGQSIGHGWELTKKKVHTIFFIFFFKLTIQFLKNQHLIEEHVGKL